MATLWEQVETKGADILEKLKELLNEGNVRRIRVRHKERTIAEFPLTFGVVGAVLAPVLAAIAAITALATDCTIEVERETPDDTPAKPPQEPDKTA